LIEIAKIDYKKKTLLKVCNKCVIQQQVPLPLPCVNFAQIAISSLIRE